MWTKLGDAAMGIVARLERGREREAPGPVREETVRDGKAPDRGAAPAGRQRARTVHARSSNVSGAAGGCGLTGIAGPAAPIAASGTDRNG
jgi:hypothetical protein